LAALRVKARGLVERNYAWENISTELGAFVDIRTRVGPGPYPFFSVIVPTYERRHQLLTLLHSLHDQTERDFEVIIVDQSLTDNDSPLDNIGVPMYHFRTSLKGAVKARNVGSRLATGHILCFIDDDCIAGPDWLLNARKYFSQLDVVAIEGLIWSDHHGDPEWRPVTNVDFRGIGFMTANLMVRSSVFFLEDGFDEAFDDPHFREDTDLGWRLQRHGIIPFAEDVEVFHPAQPRSLLRESIDTRSVFFQQDALLFKKHSSRFIDLFQAEKQVEQFPLYWKYLQVGAQRHSVDIDSLLRYQ
jgi:glycosyltransferase involved in cell wall biosynthesis